MVGVRIAPLEEWRREEVGEGASSQSFPASELCRASLPVRRLLRRIIEPVCTYPTRHAMVEYIDREEEELEEGEAEEHPFVSACVWLSGSALQYILTQLLVLVN